MDLQKLLNCKSTRKEARKNKRELKKIVKKAKHQKISIDDAVNEQFNRNNKKKKHRKQKPKTKTAKAARKAEMVRKELEEGLSEEKAFYSEIKQAKVKQLKDEIEEDDAEIKKYEKLLRLGKKNKTKNIPRSIVEAGIADLWEFCETDKRKKLIEEEDENDLGLNQITSNSATNKVDLHENERILKDKKLKQNKEKELQNSRKRKHVEIETDEDEDMSEDFDEDEGDIENEMDEIDDILFGEEDSDVDNDENEIPEDEDMEDKEMMMEDGDDEADMLDDDELAEDDDLAEDNADDMFDEDEEPRFKEDIYGRKIDLKTGEVVDQGTTIGAQKKLEELNQNNEQLAEQKFKIGKTLRGALNRLNERTLVTACKSLEELFHNNSHNDVKTILFESMLKAIQTIYLLPERLLIEYAVFISLAHINISSELSNNFVESLTLYLLNELNKEEERNDKALENATALMAHLFNFKVIKPHFIIDIMVKMRNLSRENTISLMMHSLTNCGDYLKKRAGTLLQTFVNESQNFFTNLSDDQKTSRMKYLIEDLLSSKNGNISTITSKFDISQLEHYSKLLKTLTKKSDNMESELPFSVDDVLHINERGRWWIVGSAWKPTGDKTSTTKTETIKQSKVDKFGEDLLQLAKKAKMNTEMRKNIFCSIVGSEDDIEAFEKLLKLGLKGTQEREIIHIAIVCTMMEATYNPYYATIIERFCNYHKRFKLTTQFAIWDRINDLENLKKRQRINIAFLTADLIHMEALPLSILKVINFGVIEVTTTAFLRRTFYRLLSKSTVSNITKMFKKISNSEPLKTFAEGLKLFFEISMRPESLETTDDPLIIKKIELVDELLSIDED